MAAVVLVIVEVIVIVEVVGLVFIILIPDRDGQIALPLGALDPVRDRKSYPERNVCGNAASLPMSCRNSR